MKKLLILACAIAIASVSQATNIKWGINSGALDTEKFADGSQIYLIQGSGFAYAEDLASATSFSIDKVSGTSYDNGSLASGAFVNGTGVGVTTSSSGLSGFQPFYLVAISSDGKNIAYTGTSSVNIANTPMSGSVTLGAGDFSVKSASDGPGPIDVPEPTSLALIALGVAAFGLKRKHA